MDRYDFAIVKPKFSATKFHINRLIYALTFTDKSYLRNLYFCKQKWSGQMKLNIFIASNRASMICLK